MALRVLLIESDVTTRRRLRGHLESLGVQVAAEVADPQEIGPGKTFRADAAFVGIPEGPAGEPALAALARLPRALPGVSIVATGAGESTELVLRALRAGAVEFVRHPLTKDDVSAAVEKVKSLRSSGSAGSRDPGQVTAVYAAKGGLGVSTLATNLAVCLAQEAPDETVLIDLDVSQGAVATFLNLKPTYSVLDAFGQVERLDETFLRGLLLRHPSGLLVLPAPAEASRPQFTPEQIRAGLAVVRSNFAHLVLDVPDDIEASTVAVLEEADQILYLVGLSVPALRASSAGLAALRYLGIDQRKLRVVVMRANAREEVDLKGVREALALPIFWRTPSDYPTVVASLNEGRPLVLAAPRSEIARNFKELGHRLSRNGSGKEEGQSWIPGIFRRVLTQSA